MVIIAFKTLSEQDFNALSNSFSPIISGQGQGDINIFRRYRNNKLSRGRGLWSILSQVGRKALPFLRKWVLPSAKEYGKNVLSDDMAGRVLKSSLKTRGKESLKKIGSRIVKGKGSKKRRKRLSTLMKRKKLSHSYHCVYLTPAGAGQSITVSSQLVVVRRCASGCSSSHSHQHHNVCLPTSLLPSCPSDE